MASFNRVILAGNLTRDPELAHTASNTAICKFGLAMNHRWRDKNSGENREEVCFVDCVCFGRSGEVIHQYMSKGRQILVEGRLRFSQWEDQSGHKRSKLEVFVENFTFLGSGPGQGQGGGGSGGAGARSAAPAPAPAATSAPTSYEPPPVDDYGPPIDDDGVPF